MALQINKMDRKLHTSFDGQKLWNQYTHYAPTCWTVQDRSIQQSKDCDKSLSETKSCSSPDPSHRKPNLNQIPHIFNTQQPTND